MSSHFDKKCEQNLGKSRNEMCCTNERKTEISNSHLVIAIAHGKEIQILMYPPSPCVKVARNAAKGLDFVFDL